MTIAPTTELRIFLGDIERAVSGVERISRLVGDGRNVSIGSVVVAATPFLADTMMPLTIAAFQRARPRVQITV